MGVLLDHPILFPGAEGPIAFGGKADISQRLPNNRDLRVHGLALLWQFCGGAAGIVASNPRNSMTMPNERCCKVDVSQPTVKVVCRCLINDFLQHP